MKIQFVSDIHLEHHGIYRESQLTAERWLKPVEGADVLVLAGDIGHPEKPAYGLFLKWCSERWPTVVVVAGNHEFYTRVDSIGKDDAARDIHSRYEKLELLRLMAGSLPNVHFLHQGSVEVAPGTWILGCTLWSDIPEDMKKYAAQGLNDFRNILSSDVGDRATVEDYKGWHKADVAWLRTRLAAIRARGDKAVVVTHHLPSYKLIHEKYEDHPLNCCFATDLEWLIEEAQPAAWICGHSHTGSRLTIAGCHVALNPHGYPGERVETRDREAVLEI
jgi:Icc-related predicted phosphoesterase